MVPHMHTYVRYSLTWLALAIGTTLAVQASASSSVYRVELIIFERQAGTWNSGGEGWQKFVELAYPENWQRLIDPEEEAARIAKADQEESLRLSDDFLQTLAEEKAEQPDDISPSIPSSQEPQEAPVIRFYEYLPSEKRELQRARESLSGRSQYRILFHETWLQPLGTPETAPGLILHGGNQYGDYHELQGYIRLGISRFLHLQTDLWFSEFGSNTGEQGAHGPHLPLEPNASPVDESGYESTMRIAPGEGINLNLSQEDNLWGRQDKLDAESVSPYLVNQIVTLRQKRRMRSGELHYIDHPKLGLLVKLTPQ